MRVETVEGIVKLSGKMGDSVFFTRNGKIFCRSIGRPRRTGLSEKEKERHALFRMAAHATQEIMNEPVLRACWERKFRIQKRYKTLRGYIFAGMMRQGTATVR